MDKGTRWWRKVLSVGSIGAAGAEVLWLIVTAASYGFDIAIMDCLLVVKDTCKHWAPLRLNRLQMNPGQKLQYSILLCVLYWTAW